MRRVLICVLPASGLQLPISTDLDFVGAGLPAMAA
jgi:hypothetical protein